MDRQTGGNADCGYHYRIEISSTIKLVYAAVLSTPFNVIIDRVAGAIIRLVASVCVSVRLSVGAVLFEPFDL